MLNRTETFETSNGNKFWRLNGQIHQMEGPAFERVDGYKEWWLNGVLHRVEGPACEWPNGDKAWYLNGRWHREDGPAVERINGYKEWWLNGKCLFRLPSKSQPFVFIEETEDGTEIKVLTPKGTEFWKNVPGLKELAENWEKIKP